MRALYISIFIVVSTCSVIKALLLFPAKRCVPTALTEGPKHTCICTTQGVYECRTQSRNLTKTLNSLRSQTHCEPGVIYRDGNLLCTCNKHGRWKSDNCKSNFEHTTDNEKVNYTTPIGRSGITCKKNALFLVDCNICRCNSNGVGTLECTNRKCRDTDGRRNNKAGVCSYGDIIRTENELCTCSDINHYIDRLCLQVKNSTVQKLKVKELKKLVGQESKTNESINDTGKLETFKYSLDCNKCKVNKDVLSCTAKICMLVEDKPDINKILRHSNKHASNKNKAKESLENNQELRDGDKCTPGKIYKVDCNTCNCNDQGSLICTKMECLNEADLAKLKEMRSKAGKNV